MTSQPRPEVRNRILHGLFAASGAAALIYQVVWVRAFASVFGATAEAVAAILAAFFFGLAFGYDFFGRLADRTPRPLRLYATLELGIALSALLALAFIALYRAVYDELYQWLAGTPGLFTSFKLVLTAIALFPATALMGGTLPALGRAVVGDTGPLGQRGGRLYAVNIIGAVAGTLLATFALPLWIGFRGTFLAAIALNLFVAAASAWLARGARPLRPLPTAAPAPSSSQAQQLSTRLLLIAFGSGFATIALQLLWTRMLALALHNSVYSFGSVVAVFLMGLALGASLVAWLLRRHSAWRVLRISLLTTAVLILLSTAIFGAVSAPLSEAGGEASWPGHSLFVVGLVAVVILLPVVTAGMTLPCVWELWRARPGSGSRLGRPTAVNTLGSIAGPLVAGFILLPAVGLGLSIAALGVFYLAMAELGVPRAQRPKLGGWERAAAWSLALIALVVFPPTALKVVTLEPGERLVSLEEGARGAVAVIDRGGDWRIKLDNHYAIGGSAVTVEERRQGHLPLLLHPEPQRVAVIGMGTGITAGAALAHVEVERVVAMELVPEIIAAARTYFHPWNAGLVDDPRAEIVAEDGRNHLAGTDETFDVIISDLFVPWREGVGDLYSREHFETVKARLRPGGLFAQWLPLWQLSRREFEIITATLLTVFDHVTLWRGVFSPSHPSVALIARLDDGPIDLNLLAARLERLQQTDPFRDSFLRDVTGFMLLYAGDLAPLAGQLESVPLNSENRPRIEWLAPRTLVAVERGADSWLTGVELAGLYDEINTADSLPADRLFRNGVRAPRVYRLAGAGFFRAEVLNAQGEAESARALRRETYGLLEATRNPR